MNIKNRLEKVKKDLISKNISQIIFIDWEKLTLSKGPVGHGEVLKFSNTKELEGIALELEKQFSNELTVIIHDDIVV